MRRISLLIAAIALVGLGCSHTPKKSDAKSATNPPLTTGHPPAPEVGKHESASATATTSSTKVECSVKGDERLLEVRTKGEGCELIYTKFGKEGSVANSKKGTDYCQKTLDRMQEKLTGSGYTCK